ncbi:glycoside hydrolase family 43 protein [Posidoniimonas polymericola]|uniref:glycoside hydrolase family 43 protein n=1 Tax=Posidoniimonas polymericola TaxID=2528002 RepID=UPI0011B42012|nr:glycoside hydrolase family 43 protein [Posidoniimonas polymericola]
MRWLLGVWAVFALAAPKVVHAEDVLLFPYFDSNGENGVYLSWSHDGRTFHQANSGQPIFTPPQWGGGQNLTRDPSIVYNDGLFHMVWTSNWSGNIFGYASSPDLINWSTPQQVQPFPNGSEQPNNTWAPEILWDHIASDYKIVWSSTLPSELNDNDGSQDPHGGDHRMYYTSTTDFQSFSSPELIYPDLDYSVIDAHIVWQPGGRGGTGRWVMSLKREQGASQGGKNIRLAFSDAAISPASFINPTEPYVGSGTAIQGGQEAEGSSMVYWNDEWLLYWDAYTSGHYSLASSTDLENWTDDSNELSFPVDHPRHGTVMIADAANVGWRLAARGDLNSDGVVDVGDYQILIGNHLTDLSAYDQLGQAIRGDLDADGDNDFDDFRLFKTDYERTYGAGSFAAMLAVPEPAASAWLLALFTVTTLRRRRT